MDKEIGQAEKRTLKERAQQMLEDETLLMGFFEEDTPKWFDYLKDKVPGEAVIAVLLEKAFVDKDVRAIETLNKIQEDKTASIELPDSFFDSASSIQIEIVNPTQKEGVVESA